MRHSKRKPKTSQDASILFLACLHARTPPRPSVGSTLPPCPCHKPSGPSVIINKSYKIVKAK